MHKKKYILTFMKYCSICPRNCNIDRTTGAGVCGASETLQVAKVMLHHFEEPFISGTRGSGAIFFSHCNLKCVFCQNHTISHGGFGKEITQEQLIHMIQTLEEKGAHNLNLVSPTQYTLQIVKALRAYKPKIPVVWNSNGYETVHSLRLLEGLVDIFLVDDKYAEPNLAQKLSLAQDYPQVAQSAILEMRRQQPQDVFDTNGMMLKGVVVRHLQLPKQLQNTYKVLTWLSECVGKHTYISLMSQYTPFYKAKAMPPFDKPITPLEYKLACKKAMELGLENVLVQDAESATTEYTPNFDGDLMIDE